MTRAFALLDHQSRDGITGLITITSGKWTTYRKMAEVTVDLVCKKLGVSRPCRTHLEPLPTPEHKGYHELGARLSKIEKSSSYGKVICECELATQSDVINAIERGDAKSLDDIRRDIRLGMGPCQGGFCTYRAAGMLHQYRHPSVEDTNVALRDFLQERWKGLLPILWGQQMRQERLDELIYRSLLNVENLPGPKYSRIAPELYEKPSSSANTQQVNPQQKPFIRISTDNSNQNDFLKKDVLIIGAGLSGLVAGWQLAKAGLHTQVITKGWGATHWHAGCIDVLGREPDGNHGVVTSPVDSLTRLIKDNPAHPYALAGIELIDKALASFLELFAQNDYPFHGSLINNMLLPTALGALRPTCLAPETMINGDFSHFSSKQTCLLVGFSQFVDFYAELAAENLKALGYNVKAITLDLPGLRSKNFVTGRVLAEIFDRSELISEVAQALRTHLDGITLVGFPAVLGIQHPMQVKSMLELELRLPIFEIPTLPPSIPGMRIQRIFVKTIEKYGGRVTEGLQVINAECLDRQVTHVYSEAAARQKSHHANTFVLATGGFLGGGYTTSSDGYAQDSVFSIQISTPADHSDWFDSDFLSPSGHPIFKSGIPVNARFQPVQNGDPIFNNLYVVGSSLPYFDPLQERSLDGAALASGFAVSDIIIKQQA